MRTNLPVTGREVEIADGETLVSQTDPKGVITSVNRAFVRVSGYGVEELVGQPHNMIRHPDMPPQAFADMWKTLKSGRPWVGLVKNRCKNGDHYWVEANVTPIVERGQTTGYISVRRKVPRERIRAAESAYAAIRAGNAAGLRLRYGELHRPTLSERYNPLWLLTLKQRLMLSAAGVVGLGAALLHSSAGLGPWSLWILGIGSVFAFYSAWWLSHDIRDRLFLANEVFERIAQGEYNDPLPIHRSDSVGKVLIGLKSLQIRLGYEVEETAKQAKINARIVSALDAASACVMIANSDNRIVYVNRAIRAMFREAETDLRRAMPGFSADTVTGGSIDQFHANPEHQRRLLAELKTPHHARIEVGGHKLDLVVTPVFAENGERIGTVTEWKDRTAELATEEGVASVVAAAARGDFSQRIPLEGKTGFVRNLAVSIDSLMDSTAQSLEAVRTVLLGLADGDLSRRIEVQLSGLFDEMKQATNSTVDALSGIVRDIKTSVDAIHTAASEIAAGNADLSVRTEQQAASLEETAASMEELTSNVRATADHAQTASRLAQGASGTADSGGRAVGQLVATMGEIDAQSKRIEDIIGVIDGIAFQTNILALNAAVEAARAGEQGRGFAVVAGEVRSLAQRAATAAREIKSLIGESVEKSRSGAQLAARAGSTMQEVLSAVRRVSDLMGEISTAAVEQSSGIEQVNQTVTQLDEGTQQNAALVEEASAAARSMEEQAAQLRRAVARFRL
ncbi:methyl-accepting chemotaxis protein [Aquimonas voraii]|uniref:Methyl-accepting chemotaxis sensory transducer with Pas/Pac sensor n=1 Tax=Aquimonas voraii TaxID=265719 RepID=A0A1G6W8F2_9GAMM|nr:methyl-accepting chemotaxis protein [Aquimonas voraii]SDD61335.1 methyl-accepting chemotaxis sensory transducer with Pas/Pac sensor [Aquimonas voraii]